MKTMRRFILYFAFTCLVTLSYTAYAQQGKKDDSKLFPRSTFALADDSMYAAHKRIIKIEDVRPAYNALEEDSLESIFEKIIRSKYKKGDPDDYYKYHGFIPSDNYVVGHYSAPQTMVSYGTKSFFRGACRAYAYHHPFVLSPDMIWLLIEQGFANHINNNSEAMRHLFVRHQGKADLVIRRSLVNNTGDWEDLFATFAKQIGRQTKPELVELLTADFSTTTSVSRAVSQITIMEATKSYFNYIVSSPLCGIPYVILEGTPEDWQKVLNKAHELRKYEMGWWMDEVEPVLEKLVEASNGVNDNDFWMRMIRVHPKELGYMTADREPDSIVDGWILKFFPYDDDGHKLGMKKLSNFADIAPEVMKVDLKYLIDLPNGKTQSTPLEIYAGFMGLRQDTVTFALKPEIGWFVRRKDKVSETRTEYYEWRNNSGRIYLYLDKGQSIPPELYSLKEINNLELYFDDKVSIPQRLSTIKIKELTIKGEITDTETKRIHRLFPNTQIKINSKD